MREFQTDSLYYLWVLLMVCAGAVNLVRPNGIAWTIIGWTAALLWLVLMTIWFVSRYRRMRTFDGPALSVTASLVGCFVLSILTIEVWDYNSFPLFFALVALLFLAVGPPRRRLPRQ